MRKKQLTEDDAHKINLLLGLKEIRHLFGSTPETKIQDFSFKSLEQISTSRGALLQENLDALKRFIWVYSFRLAEKNVQLRDFKVEELSELANRIVMFLHGCVLRLHPQEIQKHIQFYFPAYRLFKSINIDTPKKQLVKKTLDNPSFFNDLIAFKAPDFFKWPATISNLTLQELKNKINSREIHIKYTNYLDSRYREKLIECGFDDASCLDGVGADIGSPSLTLSNYHLGAGMTEGLLKARFMISPNISDDLCLFERIRLVKPEIEKVIKCLSRLVAAWKDQSWHDEATKEICKLYSEYFVKLADIAVREYYPNRKIQKQAIEQRLTLSGYRAELRSPSELNPETKNDLKKRVELLRKAGTNIETVKCAVFAKLTHLIQQCKTVDDFRALFDAMPEMPEFTITNNQWPLHCMKTTVFNLPFEKDPELVKIFKQAVARTYQDGDPISEATLDYMSCLEENPLAGMDFSQVTNFKHFNVTGKIIGYQGNFKEDLIGQEVQAQPAEAVAEVSLQEVILEQINQRAVEAEPVFEEDEDLDENEDEIFDEDDEDEDEEEEAALDPEVFENRLNTARQQLESRRAQLQAEINQLAQNHPLFEGVTVE